MPLVGNLKSMLDINVYILVQDVSISISPATLQLATHPHGGGGMGERFSSRSFDRCLNLYSTRFNDRWNNALVCFLHYFLSLFIQSDSAIQTDR